MNKRPTSITILGWLLIVLSILGLIGFIFLARILEHPDTSTAPHVQTLIHNPVYLIASIGIIVGNLIAGIFFLKGQNWSRWLYVALFVIGMILNFVFNGANAFALKGILPGVIMFIIFICFLFGKKANAYFKGNNDAVAVQ